MRPHILRLMILLLAATTLIAQQPPPVTDRKLANVRPGHIQVKFAVGQEPIRCESWHLWVKLDGRVVIHGKFKPDFPIPAQAKALPKNVALDLTLECDSHQWRFSNVSKRVLLSGRWWVGTDYPPFQETFRDWAETKDALWIRYLIVEPTNESGFTVYKLCPAKLKDLKPGPCYD